MDILDKFYTLDGIPLKEANPYLYKHYKTLPPDELKKNLEELEKRLWYVYQSIPDIEITGVVPLRLKTYYPGSKEYPFTGHSRLQRGTKKLINKGMEDPDYNLITNNCANNTLDALNYTFETSENPILFTTPGDVRDHALTLPNAKKSDNGDIIIPLTKEQAERYDNYYKWNNRRLVKQRLLIRKAKQEATNLNFNNTILLVKKFKAYTKGNPDNTPI